MRGQTMCDVKLKAGCGCTGETGTQYLVIYGDGPRVPCCAECAKCIDSFCQEHHRPLDKAENGDLYCLDCEDEKQDGIRRSRAIASTGVPGLTEDQFVHGT